MMSFACLKPADTSSDMVHTTMPMPSRSQASTNGNHRDQRVDSKPAMKYNTYGTDTFPSLKDGKVTMGTSTVQTMVPDTKYKIDGFPVYIKSEKPKLDIPVIDSFYTDRTR
ncbi:unnamed protein product, partial [Adineta steineri]